MKIDINMGAVMQKVRMAWQQSKGELGEEILADCNEYCKMDTGLLIASSLTHSTTDPMTVELRWSTPYAARQYWGIPTAYTDKNPKATWQWCENAKREYEAAWEKQAGILLRGKL